MVPTPIKGEPSQQGEGLAVTARLSKALFLSSLPILHRSDDS
jgi:hypothetical protein